MPMHAVSLALPHTLPHNLPFQHCFVTLLTRQMQLGLCFGDRVLATPQHPINRCCRA